MRASALAVYEAKIPRFQKQRGLTLILILVLFLNYEMQKFTVCLSKNI